jgi:putative ABC transport system substrate-binding protein
MLIVRHFSLAAEARGASLARALGAAFGLRGRSMKRRDFITLLGGAIAACPLTLNAEQAGHTRRIGVLFGSAQGDRQAVIELALLKSTLQELGWVEGRNILIETRWAAADLDRIHAFARELVSLQPDLIVGHTTQVVAALQNETKTIPIVFVVVADPVGSKFVASLPRPGGNITGFINIEASLAGKWIETLKDIVPGVTRVALMFNPETGPIAYYQQPFETAARSSGIESTAAPVRNEADIERIFASLDNKPKTGLVMLPDIFTATPRNLELVISLAARYRVPAVYPYRYMVAAGGLVAYGVDPVDLFRRAPTYIDRILKGANPADLPVQLPTKFELAINLKTAKALGLDVPPSLLARADEVIE